MVSKRYVPTCQPIANIALTEPGQVQRAAEATAAEVEWEDDSEGFISE